MNKKSSQLTKAILETASGMLNCGVIGKKDYEKITMRHLKKGKLPKIDPMTSEEIKALREQAHLSQAAFASYLKIKQQFFCKFQKKPLKSSSLKLCLCFPNQTTNI